MKTSGVRREPAVDFADLRGHLLETVHEPLPPSLPDRLELHLHGLNVPAGDVRLPRGLLHLFGHALHLLRSLEVGAQALQFHAQAFQLRAVLLLQHLRGWARGGRLLFLRQPGEVHRDGTCGRCSRRRPRLRRRAGRLAAGLRKVLEGLKATSEERDLHVLQHALAQDVGPRVPQDLLLRIQLTELLLHRSDLLPLLLGLPAETLQRLVPVALHREGLLRFGLVSPQLLLQRLDALDEALLLLEQLVHFRLELGRELLRPPARLLLQRLLQHRRLRLHVPQAARKLFGLELHSLLLAPPLALDLPHVVHAHGSAQLGKVPSDSLAQLRLHALQLLSQPLFLLAQAHCLRAERPQRGLGSLQLLLLLAELFLAPLQMRAALAGLGLYPADLVFERRQVSAAIVLQRVDLVKPAVNGGDPGLRSLQLCDVEAGGALARVARVHREVPVLRNGLTVQCHHLAAEAQVSGLPEREVAAVGHRVGEDDVAQEEFERLVVPLVEGDAVEREPQGALVVHEFREPGVQGRHAEVVQRQEGHGREHALLEVLHAPASCLGGVDDDRVQELSQRHVHGDVQALLRGLAEVHHATVHALDGVSQVMAYFGNLPLLLYLALSGGCVLDGVQQLLPLLLELLLLLGTTVRGRLEALELEGALLCLLRLLHRGLGRGLLGLLELGDPPLEVLLPCEALTLVVLCLGALRRQRRDLMLELPGVVTTGGRDALCLALHALELLPLLLREVELALPQVLGEHPLLALKLGLLLLELLELGLGPPGLALDLLGVGVQILDALLQEVDARASCHPLRVDFVELGARGCDSPIGLRRGEVRLRPLALGPLEAVAAALHRRPQGLALRRGCLPLLGGLVQLPRDAVEPEEVEFLLQVLALVLQPPEGVSLVLLLSHALLLVDGVALLREEVPGVVLLLGLLCRQALVLLTEGLRA
mmetsp:Transcript_62211/g.192850  ORF Transcript_62211/g.192850 Transcript_62211/m.192850 type:complete len:935 (-) Transcript_62211:578-3382(-)